MINSSRSAYTGAANSNCPALDKIGRFASTDLDRPSRALPAFTCRTNRLAVSDSTQTSSTPTDSAGGENVQRSTFVTTHWSVVLTAGRNDATRARDALSVKPPEQPSADPSCLKSATFSSNVTVEQSSQLT